MHADSAIHAVVDDHHNDRQIILYGGSKFLSVHHEAAVTGKSDHHMIGEQTFGTNRGGDAIAHGAGGRGKLRAKMPIA